MNSQIPCSLGKLLQHDRELAGLTQGELTTKLNSVKKRPFDPHTKRPKKAHRTWIAKLESGCLARELRLEVREWLANATGGNLATYRALPVIGPESERLGEIEPQSIRLSDFLLFCRFVHEHQLSGSEDPRVNLDQLSKVWRAIYQLEKAEMPFSRENLRGFKMFEATEPS